MKNMDVIIIGGSYAGLSAAMALGRSLRNVLIIDSGLPCNRQTHYSHNFITQDGKKPAEIALIAREQVLKYETVQFIHGWAISGKILDNGFSIQMQSGDEFKAKKLILATGIEDQMPAIQGFADCWGISAIHCPYCHGYEFKGQKTALMANGEKAYHLALLIRNLTDDLTILPNGKSELTTEQTERLNKHNINVQETEISALEHDLGKLRNIHFKDGKMSQFNALYASMPFVQHSDIPQNLGCEFFNHGYIKIDSFQQTSVKGVYACGDNCGMMRSVANAVYTGNLAGAMVNMALTEEQF